MRGAQLTEPLAHAAGQWGPELLGAWEEAAGHRMS